MSARAACIYIRITACPQVNEAARIIAQALLAGGNSAKVFSDALAAAVSRGGCGAVHNILTSASQPAYGRHIDCRLRVEGPQSNCGCCHATQ